VLLTTQYLDEADQLADRIAVIDRGRVVAEGTADELKSAVGTQSLQLRLADPGQVLAAAATIRDRFRVEPTVSPEAARLTLPLDDPAAVTDLLVLLRERGLAVDELSMQKPSLDEVFLTLTGHPAEASDDADASAPEHAADAAGTTVNA
jgi:ABC-2 type transport system ATP-binding protein